MTSRLLFYLVIPTLLGCFTVSPLLIDRAIPVETNDEGAHTFIEIPAFQSSLFSGHLLKMDLFQNFGTPILGDAVICPLAPHAFTYAFFRPLIAMLINKVVIGTLTVAVLTWFYAEYLLLPLASLCAILTFTSPTFLYFFHHHPHQGVLLYFTLLLIAIRAVLREPSRLKLAALFVAALALCLGVGMHGVILSVPFAAAFCLLAPAASRKARAMAIITCVFAAISVYPQFAEFLRLARHSMRIQINYQDVLSDRPLSYLEGLVIPEKGRATSGTSAYYSIEVAMLIALGIFMSRRRKDEEYRLIVWLGLIPFLVVTFLKLFRGVTEAIPLLRSTNVVRTLWFSDIFLMLFAGLFLSDLLAEKRSRALIVAMGLFLVVLAVDRIRVNVWQLRDFRASFADTTFQPASFVPLMAPGRRLAADLDVVLEHNFDIRATYNGVLSSSGRAILMNDDFYSTLLSRNLVQPGWFGMVYFFKPNSPEVLAKLGIRYFGTIKSAARLESLGWRKSAEASGYTLFEAPAPVSAVYIDSIPPTFLQSYEIRGDRISVDLPPLSEPRSIVATFLALPGWKASVDGNSVPIQSGPYGFLKVQIANGRKLDLWYEPYTTRTLLLIFLAGIVLFAATVATLCGARACQTPPSALHRLSGRAHLSCRAVPGKDSSVH